MLLLRHRSALVILLTAWLVGCQPTTRVTKFPTRQSTRVEATRSPKKPAQHSEPSGTDKREPKDSTATFRWPMAEIRSSLGDRWSPTCLGRDVNLARMEDCRCQLRLRTLTAAEASNHTSCSEVFYDTDLRDTLEVRLISERDSVQSGEILRLVIILTNTSPNALGLVFRSRPDHDPHTYPGLVRVLDTEGTDRTTAGSVASVSGWDRGDYLVVLAPHGTARYVIAWQVGTVTGMLDTQGSLDTTIADLPPGNYRLTFPLFFDDSLGLTEEQRNPSVAVTVSPAPMPEKLPDGSDVAPGRE